MPRCLPRLEKTAAGSTKTSRLIVVSTLRDPFWQRLREFKRIGCQGVLILLFRPEVTVSGWRAVLEMGQLYNFQQRLAFYLCCAWLQLKPSALIPDTLDQT